MNIGTIWIVWIIVVIVIWAILYYPGFGVGLRGSGAFFFALIIGLIVVFALSLGFLNTWNEISTNDKQWLSLLWFVAYLLPLIVAIWIAVDCGYARRVNFGCNMWGGRQGWGQEQGSMHHEGENKLVMQCDPNTGACQPVMSRTHVGNTEVKTFYQ